MVNSNNIYPEPEDLDTLRQQKKESKKEKPEEERPKKSFNVRWLAKNILPIFLVVIFSITVAIAAVPQWRNAFNRFLAKFSPKAEIETQCGPTTAKDEMLTGLAPFSITPEVVRLGDTVTASIENTRDPIWMKRNDQWFAHGAYELRIMDLPRFNKQGYQFKDDGSLDKNSKISVLGNGGSNEADGIFYARNGWWHNNDNHRPDDPDVADDFWFDAVIWKATPNEVQVLNGDDGLLEKGNYQVSFKPTKKTDGWKVMHYNIIDAYHGNIQASGYPIRSSYAVYIDNVRLDLQAKEKEIFIQESAGQISGATTLDIYSYNNDQPFSSNILLKGSSEKVKFSGEGVSGPDQDGWYQKTTDSNGKATVKVESSGLGKFTITAKSKDACQESRYYTEISFVQGQAEVKVKEDHSIDEEGNLTLLASGKDIAEAEIYTKKIIDQAGNSEALANRKVKITFPVEGAKISSSKNAAEDNWQNGSEGIELTTNSNGKANVYVKSTKPGKANITVKDSENKFEALSNRKLDFKAPELITPNITSACAELKKEQKEIFEDIISEDEPTEEESQSSLIKKSKFSDLKNKLFDLFGFKKAYSEENAQSFCFNLEKEIKKIYPGDTVKIEFELDNTFDADVNNFEVYASLNSYFKLLVYTDGGTLETKDGSTTNLVWKIDKLKAKEKKTFYLAVELLDQNLPENGQLFLPLGSRTSSKNESGDTLELWLNMFIDLPLIEIDKIEREGKTIPQEEMEKDAEGKEKIYPGDKIYYHVTYTNNSSSPLYFASLIARVSDQASDWTDKDKHPDWSEKLRHLVVFDYDKIDVGQKVEADYWVQLKNEIDLEAKTVGTWAGIGDLGYQRIVFPSSKDIKWLKHNLWGKISGQLRTIGDQPLPGVTVGLLTKDHILPSFEKNYHNISEPEGQYLSDLQGRFSLEFNRQKDFHDSQKYKVSVSYFSDGENKISMRSGEFGEADALHFRTSELDLPTGKEGIQDIKIGRGGSSDPYIEYPDNEDYLTQVEIGSSIYRNLYWALNFAKENYGYNLSLPADELIIKMQPKGENYPSYYNGNTIYLNSNVWSDRASRGSGEELHEFGHFILDKIGLKTSSVLPASDDSPDLSVDLVSEDECGYCGYASVAMVYNYVMEMTRGNPTEGGWNKKSSREVKNDLVSADTNLPGVLNNYFNGHWDNPDFNDISQLEGIIESLQLGYPVIMFADFYGNNTQSQPGHIFLLTGYDAENGTFWVNNPLPFAQQVPLRDTHTHTLWSYENEPLTKQILWAHRNYYSGYGGPNFIRINLEYARANPLIIQAGLSHPDLGYLNDNTNQSLIEGAANFIAADLERRLSSVIGWYYFGPDGTIEYDLTEIHPAFVNYGDLYPSYLGKIAGGENWTLSSLLVALNDGLIGSYQNSYFRWTRFGENDQGEKYQPYNLNFPRQSPAANDTIVNYLKELAGKEHQDIWGLYNILQAKGVGQDGTNEIGLNYLDQLFVLFGFFKDSDRDWRYDPGEVVAKTANLDSFKASTKRENIIIKESIINNPTVITSPYLALIKNISGKSEQKSSYIITHPIMTFPMGEIDKLFSPRPSRLAPTRIDGSYIKFHFLDKDNKQLEEYTLQAEVTFPEEFKAFDYSFDFLPQSGNLVYLTLPFATYPTKISITAKDSPDSLLINSDDYWPVVTSEATFSYMAEKTFHIGVKESPPEEKPPAIDTGDGSARGGQSTDIEVGGFNQSKKVAVYLDKKKIAQTPILADKFGLKINLPENISLGQHEVEIIGDNDEQASGTIKITANKWFNNINYAIVIISLLILVLIYFIYRVMKNLSKNYPSSPIEIHNYQ